MIKAGAVDFYCSKACASQDGNFNRVRTTGEVMPAGMRHDNRRDALTPFRWFVLRARQRLNVARKDQTNLTAEYLADVWRVQCGVCPITGWSMLLPNNTNGWIGGLDMRNASLDRIDNEHGYVRGNVRFVSVMANLARGQFTDAQLRDFCGAVVANGLPKGTP